MADAILLKVGELLPDLLQRNKPSALGKADEKPERRSGKPTGGREENTRRKHRNWAQIKRMQTIIS